MTNPKTKEEAALPARVVKAAVSPFSKKLKWAGAPLQKYCTNHEK